MSHPKDVFLGPSYFRSTRVLPRSYSVPAPFLLAFYSAPALGTKAENSGKRPKKTRAGNCQNREEINRPPYAPAVGSQRAELLNRK